MLKCIAIDDEPLALRQLTSYISKIPYLELAATFNNALEAQQMLTGQSVDLIFVDINMPDLNGVDFVRGLIERPMIIFTTAYSEYAVEAVRQLPLLHLLYHNSPAISQSDHITYQPQKSGILRQAK